MKFSKNIVNRYHTIIIKILVIIVKKNNYIIMTRNIK